MPGLYATLISVALVTTLLWMRANYRRITVFEYQRGLMYSKGRFARVLEPGQYWIYKPTTTVQIVDTRVSFVTIPGQEILTSDGVGLKVSLAAKYEIADPRKAINDVEAYFTALYVIIQTGLREVIGMHTIDELLDKRSEFGALLMDKASAQADNIGLRLLDVDIKDIMLPGDMKKVYSQVVKARQEGLAALERARGESAALRSLANAAKLMEDHPGLLQLRALQQIGETTGGTIVLGSTPDAVPLTSRASRPKQPETETQ